MITDEKQDYIVFLGAGASIPLGFPGGVQLVEVFKDQISKGDDYKKQRLLKTIDCTKSSIERNGFQCNSESFYSCLQGYCEPSKWMKNSGPFPCLMCMTQPISSISPHVECSPLRQRFEEFMIGQFYNDDPDLHKRIKQTYNRFFSKISGTDNWKDSVPDWRKCNFHIFTTNYDRVIETYAEQVNQKICIGSRLIEENKVLFTPEDYDRFADDCSIFLYKLHGSVELSILEDNTIISSIPPGFPGNTTTLGQRISSKVMVYGIYKNLFSEPYFELLNFLKQRLTIQRKCWVVGYSFRDSWINQIFIDVINNKLLTIDLIDTKANTNLPNLPIIDGASKQVASTLEDFLDLPKELE